MMPILMGCAGHQQAYACGILHRDVSEGNILIVDGQPFGGFLHDFDYSSFYKDDMQELEVRQHRRDSGESTTMDPQEAIEELKERTVKLSVVWNWLELMFSQGTLQFMAIELLDLIPGQKVVHRVHHDLESFYWVLVWIVLRHTKHTHPKGADACRSTFPPDNENDARAHKQSWFHDPQLEVEGNGPLTALLANLHELVRKRVFDGALLTHETMLHAFELALARKDWPTGDAAIPFTPVDTSKLAPAMNAPDTGLPSMSMTTPAASGSKRQQEAELEEEAEEEARSERPRKRAKTRRT